MKLTIPHANLKDSVYQHVVDSFKTFDVKNKLLVEDSFLAKIIIKSPESVLGYRISIIDNDAYIHLSNEENIFGMSLYLIGLTTGSNDHIKSARILYRESGAIQKRKILSDTDDFIMGSLISFLKYRVTHSNSLWFNTFSDFEHLVSLILNSDEDFYVK